MCDPKFARWQGLVNNAQPVWFSYETSLSWHEHEEHCFIYLSWCSSETAWWVILMNVCHSLGMVFHKLVFPLKPFQTVLCLFTSPSPCHGMERKMGGTKGKDHGVRWEQFTGNSNEMKKKRTVRTAILTTEGTRKANDSHTETPWQHQLLPLSHCADPEGALPLSRKMVWGYGITSRSCSCLVLATAKINRVLAGSRLMWKGNRCSGRYNGRSPLFAYKCPTAITCDTFCKWGKSRSALKPLRKKTFIL